MSGELNSTTSDIAPASRPSSSGVTIEVCVDSVESALAAVQGGADRLEICGNLGLGGGTTPSAGLVRTIKKSCPGHISLMAMIRPRTGDFVYSDAEQSVMLDDIATFAQMGVDGVVFGALLPDGAVDVDTTARLARAARELGLEVCFHRAFDMVKDQEKALYSLLAVPGITRILTSGGGPSAPSPASLQSLTQLSRTLLLLAQSQSQSQSRAPEPEPEPEPERTTPPPPLPSLMPGAGISARTAQPLLRALLPLGVRAVHLSGGGWVDGPMRHRPAGMGMGVGVGAGVGEKGEWGMWRTDGAVVREVRRLVDEEWARSGLC